MTIIIEDLYCASSGTTHHRRSRPDQTKPASKWMAFKGLRIEVKKDQGTHDDASTEQILTGSRWRTPGYYTKHWVHLEQAFVAFRSVGPLTTSDQRSLQRPASLLFHETKIPGCRRRTRRPVEPRLDLSTGSPPFRMQSRRPWPQAKKCQQKRRITSTRKLSNSSFQHGGNFQE